MLQCEWTLMTLCLVNKLVTKGQVFHLHEIPRVAKFVETEIEW
jgi:hypothetical protein